MTSRGTCSSMDTASATAMAAPRVRVTTNSTGRLGLLAAGACR